MRYSSNESALSKDKDFKTAKNEKAAYETIFNNIAKTFGSYGSGTKTFSLNQHYMRPDDTTNVDDNMAGVTSEPMLLIDIASAGLAHFTMPLEKESIRLQPLRATLLEQGNVRFSQEDTKFFENAGRVLQKIIMNPALGFSSIFTSALRQLLLLGSTAILTDCTEPTVPVFKVLDFREIFIYRDDVGKLKKIYREFTPRDQKTDIKEAKRIQCFELLEDEDNKLSSEIAIKYTLYNEEGEIEEMLDGKKAYPYWPIAVTSLFEEPGYQYSSSIGQRMMPHVIRLNALKKMLFSAGHLQIQPPLQLLRKNVITTNLKEKKLQGYGNFDDDNFKDLFTYYLRPGQVVPVQGSEPVLSPILQSTDLRPFEVEVQAELSALRQHSYVDILTLSDLSGNASVEEVVEKVSRKISILNPLVSSASRLLNEIVMRVFLSALAQKDAKQYFLTNSVLPEGKLLPINIHYENQFTKLPSFSKARALGDLAMRLGQLSQIDPTFVDAVNMDLMVKDLLTLEGYGYLKASEEQIEEKRDARLKQE